MTGTGRDLGRRLLSRPDREAGATFLLVPEPETAETFRAMVTQDFALMLHCQDDYRMFLSWTDYNAYYVEPCLMSLWLLAGGNVLFGDWGRPEATQKKQGPPERERELVSIVTRGRSEQLRRGREEEETV